MDRQAAALDAYAQTHGGKPLLHLRPRLRPRQHRPGTLLHEAQECGVSAFQRGRGLPAGDAAVVTRHPAHPKLHLLHA
jgi:hypothetical protein